MTDYDALWHIMINFDILWQILTDDDRLWQIMLYAVCCFYDLVLIFSNHRFQAIYITIYLLGPLVLWIDIITIGANEYISHIMVWCRWFYGINQASPKSWSCLCQAVVMHRLPPVSFLTLHNSPNPSLAYVWLWLCTGFSLSWSCLCWTVVVQFH